MTIEILHSRDPDGDCTIRVFADGVDITDTAKLVDIDPGHGWTRADWDAQTAAIDSMGLSDAMRNAVHADLDVFADSEFITD